jgi:parallel beta-helix repeat protein
MEHFQEGGRFIMVKRVLLTIALLALACVVSAQSYVMFNYTGRVKVQGHPFTGSGQFKFALVDEGGVRTLWSNDGTSVAGSEPTASVSLSTQEGLFSGAMGDPELGMRQLNAALFNQPNPIFMRTWFSDGTHGFQRLMPDNRIVNPELIGVLTGEQDFTIYVDGTNGNDDNEGLTTDTAKKTIQAAVDLLSERVACNVTIQIAAGVYPEQVAIGGITMRPGKYLTISGDPTWTAGDVSDPTVQVTGLISGTTYRSFAFQISMVNRMIIEGIQMDHASNAALEIADGRAIINRCKFTESTIGCHAINGTLTMQYCEVNNNTGNGCYLEQCSQSILTSCNFTDNGLNGLLLIKQCACTAFNCTFSGNDIGARLVYYSALYFSGTAATNTLVFSNNTRYGINAYRCSQVDRGSATLHYSGNGTSNTLIDTGSYLF